MTDAAGIDGTGTGERTGTAQEDALRVHRIAERAWADSEPEPRVWSSGRWSLERRGDELADIRYDGELVLRSVRAVARDRDWNTVPTTVVAVRESDAGVDVDLRMTGLGADIEGTLSLTATPGGTNEAATNQAGTNEPGDELSVRFSAVSHTDFERNRLGLVVLHPPAAAGAPLEVTSPSGRSTSTSFPVEIAPHQPAMDIASLAWRAGGVRVDLAFAGDVFEMEDQRNWTDASYKTYSTPLTLPFPVLVTAGTVVEQSLTLRCHTEDALGAASVAAPDPTPARLRLVPAGRPLPSIAVGASTAAGSRPAGLTTVGDALLVELEAAAPNWRAALRRAAHDADGRPLDARVVAAIDDEVDAVLDALAGLPVARLGVFSPRSHVSESALWAALVRGVHARGIAAELVGGARSHFTELNRRHQDLPGDIPALTFSVTPQMHARERAQVVESLPQQRLVAENAVRIAGGRPVHVGPVTLRSRFNAVATSGPAGGDTDDVDDVDGGYGAEHVPGATDARQESAALAAWAVASASALAVPGVAGITYFEEWGPRGLAEADGRPFPVATALAGLHALAGRPALEPEGPVPPGLWLVAANRDGAAEVLLANLTPDDITVAIEAPGVPDTPVTVAAYGIARVPG